MICRVCDSTRLEPVLDLGEQPWCNHFLRPEEIGTEPFYPLRLVYCHDCSTAQLDYTVKKEVMFGDHTYLSGVTRSLDEHFRGVAQEVERRLGPSKARKNVLDIGSNDGTQLKHFQGMGYDVLGVESSKTTARMANAGQRADAQSSSSIRRSRAGSAANSTRSMRQESSSISRSCIRSPRAFANAWPRTASSWCSSST